MPEQPKMDIDRAMSEVVGVCRAFTGYTFQGPQITQVALNTIQNELTTLRAENAKLTEELAKAAPAKKKTPAKEAAK